MKVATLGFIGVTALLSTATTLHADIITETLNGTVLTGIDNAAIFGPLGANLAGNPITATFTFNRTQLIADGIYSSAAGIQEQIFNGTITDGALTETITVHGVTFTLTQGANGMETILTQKDGAGSSIESILFNTTTGTGASITIHSSTPYQFPTLLGNPKPFFDSVASTATSVVVGIDLQGGAFQTDIVITAITTPEPSTISLWMVAGGALLVLRMRRRTA
jgi:hypothetical protein